MSITAIVFSSIFVIVIVMVIVNLVTMPLNDFLEKTVKKFLWLWLPFHAFKRLSKEFRKKYMK